ncbi:MAG: CoA transferase [Gammaproteobacteria bacterium]|nr:CoA transferase [Gammaproteobacteria bacterium]
MNPTDARPLDGVLVVSLEQAVAAPLATCRLADAGARVIKLERANGDFARAYDTAANGQSAYFAWLNRGKESLTVDIKDEADRELVLRILAKADVFIQNLAVGAAARSGLGSDELRARFPHLITCDISGYGETGPYADMKAYDLLVQAEAGLVSVNGTPGPYGRVGISVCDTSTGLSAALGINEALVKRQRTGVGSAIKLSLFDVMADLMAVPLLHHDYLGAGPERIGLAHPSITPYGGFVTGDGVTLVISVQNDREWASLATEVMERPELVDDPHYATNPARLKRREVVDGMVQEFFSRHTRSEMEDKLRRARIAYGAVNDVTGLSVHPHLRRLTVESETGDVEVPAHPNAAAQQPRTPRLPRIGEHNERIRQEFSE